MIGTIAMDDAGAAMLAEAGVIPDLIQLLNGTLAATPRTLPPDWTPPGGPL